MLFKRVFLIGNQSLHMHVHIYTLGKRPFTAFEYRQLRASEALAMEIAI